MKLRIYSLSYCEHCVKLKRILKEEGIEFEDIDADVDYDESTQLESILETNAYPIVEMEMYDNVIYYVSENIQQTKIKDGVYKHPYATIDSLVHQILILNQE